VDNGIISIPGTKTDAALRKVPAHSAIGDLLVRLVTDSKDGYLIPSSSDNQYHERSAAIGKRFGRLKTSLGFGPEHVFHSIRKTVATLLEDAQCPEGIAADIIGHDKPTMTYGLYSGGPYQGNAVCRRGPGGPVHVLEGREGHVGPMCRAGLNRFAAHQRQAALECPIAPRDLRVSHNAPGPSRVERIPAWTRSDRRACLLMA
jgi:hypothetical protein